MPFFFRKVRRRKWDRQDPKGQASKEDLQADALGDLRTNENSLSLFMVDDDLGNLDRIAAALAANTERPNNLDYVLVDSQALNKLGLKEIPSPGETHDKEVNKTHIDMAVPNAQKLVDLAFVFWNEGDTKRIPGKRVRQLIDEGVEAGHIELNS